MTSADAPRGDANRGSSAGAGQLVLLGEIATAHGVRGEVLVRSFTAEPEAIARYGPLLDEHGGAPLRLRVVRVTPKGVVARVEGVADRNGAEALRGRKLHVNRASLPEIAGEDDDFYHADLLGLAAHDRAGKLIGKVVGVANYGAGDLLEVRLAGSRKTELVPFTKAHVPDVDVPAGRLTVDVAFATEDQSERRERTEAERAEREAVEPSGE